MKTKTKVVKTIKDEIIQFGLRFISEFSLRPRLIKTGNFYRHCSETRKFHRSRDRDFARLRNITVVETESDRDWVTCRDRDFIESLADLYVLRGLKFYHV